ncbi:MAG: cytochrome P450 [Phormidesmis priestleyi Ana]|uniref:Cytochrome P450 n=1 Tax=Phormidesmis priestleyi Ana TaxID=1666911 RepID=A0A0P7YRM3_9CYAN|nr:MAG: cytochrome P450 [Phormidesmis priestleyi Ana]
MTAPIPRPLAYDIPGPKPLPLIGRTLNTLQFVKDSVGYTRQLFNEYGNLVSLVEGGGTRLYSSRSACPGTVFACGPELTRQVTTQQDVYHKGPLTGPLYRLRNHSERTKPLRHFLVGIFADNDDRHLQQRKLMMPAFHRQRLQSYAQDMVTITEDELNQLAVDPDPDQIKDISAFMRQVTLRIATKSLFGEDVGSKGGKTGSIIQEAFMLQVSPSIKLLRLDLPGLAWHRYLSLAAQYESVVRGLIATKKQRGSDEPDVLSMLMQAQDEETKTGLTEEELLGHVGVIFVAGHETSANALTWTLFLLSQHPQIMADVVDELAAVLQGEAPSLEKLQQLPLLDRVVKESMRVLAPVPWNGRVTAKPTELGGYSLPEGTEVLVSISQTHHMSELYPNPESFDPSRWETIAPTAYEYNPFSAGPRICIGAGFAMMEIKIVLAMLLQRYRLQFVPKNPIDRAGIIVMTPKHGMLMKIHRQDRQFNEGVGGVKGNIRDMVQLPQ